MANDQANQTSNSVSPNSIGQYLIRRLGEYGVGDVFGIPGDYVLTFYSQLETSELNVVGCTREDCAGFAADAYSRLNGMGALCITYCVGGLSVCNSVAGAFAEKSPIVVISGAPGLNERHNNPLLHHKVREFRTQLEVFEKLCVASTELTDPYTAFAEIDRVLEAAAKFKRPVYIELPRDMVDVVPVSSTPRPIEVSDFNEESLSEAVAEAAERLAAAKKPMIIAGVEIHRFGLQDKVAELAEKLSIPIAATILGKSVIRETHPLYIGLYEGALGRAEVTEFVEDSDCILMLGTFMTDINLGIYTANLNLKNCIYATSEQLQVSHHHFHAVSLDRFLDSMIQSCHSTGKRDVPASLHPEAVREDVHAVEVEPDAELKVSRMMKILNKRLHKDNIVVADIGDALFASTELVVHEKADFLSPAYYTSMGFATPATLGACVAKPDQRVISIIGDGAFQMTGNELSTIIRHGFAPIMIILDNHGYGTERYLHEGEWVYNEIHPWHYHRLPEIYGGGKGYYVVNEGEFETALEEAYKDTSCLQLIHAKLKEGDASKTLLQLADKLGSRV